jgi:hypothetical protein
MLLACIITNILAIALPSLRISPLFRIVTIALLCAAALSFNAVYIQSIGSGIGIFSELLIFSPLASALVPIKPADYKPNRLTKAEQSQFALSEDLKNILVGLILGDIFIYKACANARLCFKQGLIHKDYLEHLYELFKNYCSKAPVITNRLPDRRTGKIYNGIYFYSYALPCINEFYDLFYVAGKKIIPSNIKELLTPLGFAYWLADDGCFCKTSHRVFICTESFTLSEINLLVETLNDKWNLECYQVKRGNSSRIIIPRRSLGILQGLLKDVMPLMMLHKLGL